MPHAAIVVDKRLPAGVFVRLIEGAESFHEVRYQDDVWRVLGQTLPRVEMEGWGPKARVAR